MSDLHARAGTLAGRLLDETNAVAVTITPASDGVHFLLSRETAIAARVVPADDLLHDAMAVIVARVLSTLHPDWATR